MTSVGVAHSALHNIDRHPPRKRGSQYAAASRFYLDCSGILDRPVKPGDVVCWASNVATTIALRRLRLRIPDRAPDPFRRQRHVDMGDAVFGERIEHRVDD